MDRQTHTMTDPVETARLTLRHFQEADVDGLYEIQRDKDAMRYTFCSPSRAESERRLRAYAALLEELGYAPWTVILRAESRIIGWGGLNVDPFDPGWGVEVAYFFHPSYWGRGFATELVQAALEQGFTQHGLETIGAFAHRENIGSIRVLEKCGFRFTGFEPQLNRNRYRIDQGEWPAAADRT
jgi:ribosomal-protein-alanine N-acetyltransferase